MDDTVKQEVAMTIWGDLGPETDLKNLDPYFEYFTKETKHAALLSNERVRNNSVMMSAFVALKSNPNMTKEQLDAMCGDAVVTGLAVRLMFMTSCHTPGTLGGDIFRPVWKRDETLCQYIDRIYPRCDPTPDGSQSQPIFMHRLTADFLKRYANIDIRWTERLSDHLLLMKGSDWKSLYLFSHPGFLTTSLEVLVKGSHGGTTDAALLMGCLPASLLQETLESLEILFPLVGDAKAQHILKSAVRDYKLDPALLQPFQHLVSEHKSPADALLPVDVNGLYKRFPFWAERLHGLSAEANDPTPITPFERLTHRKQSPRFTYWCAVVAVIIGILFGVFATILGALQVWISYCSWLDDPSINGCGRKHKS
ncbi:hypothetical protein F5Y18DRAFT_444567 [Xylariaceae sp. FL1019]|nr:hypothetical protein F5Y18DRAFT_444567 [Xylariaceae sp. FL1019]